MFGFNFAENWLKMCTTFECVSLKKVTRSYIKYPHQFACPSYCNLFMAVAGNFFYSYYAYTNFSLCHYFAIKQGIIILENHKCERVNELEQEKIKVRIWVMGYLLNIL